MGIHTAGNEVMTAIVNITDNDAVKAAVSAGGAKNMEKVDALANIARVLYMAIRPIDDFLTADLNLPLNTNVNSTRLEFSPS